MKRYAKEYLDEVVETQGKLFLDFAENYPDCDTEDFINKFMTSKTRKYIDEGQAYVITMDPKELWEYFCKIDHFKPIKGKPLQGFLPDWIGEFYALYQWHYGLKSSEVIRMVPISFLKKAYPGLHDLDLKLAVEKTGGH